MKKPTSLQSAAVDPEAVAIATWGRTAFGRICLWIGVHNIDLLACEDFLALTILEGAPIFTPGRHQLTGKCRDGQCHGETLRCTAPSGAQQRLPAALAGHWITLTALSVDALIFREEATRAAHARLRLIVAALAVDHYPEHASAFANLCD